MYHYIKYEFDTEPGDLIRIKLNIPANVRLLDPDNYEKYANGQSHNYHGGHATKSPVTLKPPHPGHWYLVIDLGGFGGHLRVWAEQINHPQSQTA